MTPTGKTLFLVIALVAVLLTPLIGSSSVSLTGLFDPSSPSHRIVFELRVPRLVLALVVGGSLAILGGTYQILFHNPLAEPYILGVSNAVILGVALSETCFGLPSYSYGGPVIGFFAAMIITVAMLVLCMSKTGQAMHRLILFGMGVQFVLSSVLFLLMSYFSHHMGGGTLRWLFGQIPWLDTGKVCIFAGLSVPFLVFLLATSRHLDALTLGDGVSRTLGFSPDRTRVMLLVLTSAFISLIVSFTGAIGFVGLVVPHVTRLIFRPASTRVLFSFSFVIGGSFLVISDVLSRTLLPPFEFPIGILTTLVGGPIFLYLLWKR